MSSTFFEYTHTWLVFYYTVWLVHTLWDKSRLFDYKRFFFLFFLQLLLVWQESTTVVASKMKDNIVNYAVLHTCFQIIFIHMFGSTLESFVLSPQGKCIFFVFFLLPYSKLFHTDRSKAGNMLIHYKIQFKWSQPYNIIYKLKENKWYGGSSDKYH